MPVRVRWRREPRSFGVRWSAMGCGRGTRRRPYACAFLAHRLLRVRQTRVALAEDRTRAAEAEAREVQRITVGEALDLWVRRWAPGPVYDSRPSENSWTRTPSSPPDPPRRGFRRRRRGGSRCGARCGGDRTPPCGRGRPGKPSWRSLRGRLGIPTGPRSPFRRASDGRPGFPHHAVRGAFPARRPVRAAGLIRAAQTDVTLQDRQGAPVPRVTLAGGRDVEYFTHVGVDLPLPVYQRNQGGRALAGARAETATAERAGSLAWPRRTSVRPTPRGWALVGPLTHWRPPPVP